MHDFEPWFCFSHLLGNCRRWRSTPWRVKWIVKSWMAIMEHFIMIFAGLLIAAAKYQGISLIQLRKYALEEARMRQDVSVLLVSTIHAEIMCYNILRWKDVTGIPKWKKWLSSIKRWITSYLGEWKDRVGTWSSSEGTPPCSTPTLAHGILHKTH